MADITIPKDVAERYATQLRTLAAAKRGNVTRFEADDLTAVADLLDPPAPSLHQVVTAVILNGRHFVRQAPSSDIADAALAAIADAVEALPLPTHGVSHLSGYQDALRDVEALLRGESRG